MKGQKLLLVINNEVSVFAKTKMNINWKSVGKAVALGALEGVARISVVVAGVVVAAAIIDKAKKD